MREELIISSFRYWRAHLIKNIFVYNKDSSNRLRNKLFSSSMERAALDYYLYTECSLSGFEFESVLWSLFLANRNGKRSLAAEIAKLKNICTRNFN